MEKEMIKRIEQLEKENKELKEECEIFRGFTDDLYEQVYELRGIVERLCSKVYDF